MPVKIVDARNIRNTIDTDFNGVGTHGDYPYIPLGEIWIDKFLKDEQPLFLKLWKLERSMRGKSFRLIREKAKKSFSQPLGAHVAVKKTLHKGTLTIRYVDGATVRKAFEPYFLIGGHDRSCSYIPKLEVWVDAKSDPRDWKYLLLQLLEERERMSKGMARDDAHDFALAAQRMARRKDGVAEFTRG